MRRAKHPPERRRTSDESFYETKCAAARRPQRARRERRIEHSADSVRMVVLRVQGVLWPGRVDKDLSGEEPDGSGRNDTACRE